MMCKDFESRMYLEIEGPVCELDFYSFTKVLFQCDQQVCHDDQLYRSFRLFTIS